MANTTLDEAVSAAVEKETQPSVEETKVEETPTSQETTPSVDQAEAQQALGLFRALNDPEVGPALLETLARKAGLLVQQNKATEQQVTKATLDVLKESLGTEYEFLAERLEKGLTTLIDRAVEAKVKPIQENSQRALEKAVERETDAEMAEFYSKFKDAKEYDKELTDLAKKMPYNGEGKLSDYLANLYKIATYDRKAAKTVEKTVGRINQNAKEVRETSVEVNESTTKRGSKLPTLDEALKAGARGEKLF